MELKSGYEKTRLLINQKIINLNEKLENLKIFNQRTIQHNSVLEGKKEHLEKEKEKLETEISRIYERMRIVQKKASETKLSWKKQHDELALKEAQLKQVKDDVFRQKESSVNLHTSLNTCKEKIDFIKNEIGKITDEANRLSESLVEIESQLKKEDFNVSKIRSELDTLKSSKEHNLNEIAEANEQIRELESTFNKASSRKEALEKAFNLSETTGKGMLSFDEVTIEDGFKKTFEAAVSSYHNLILASNKNDMTKKLTEAAAGHKILNLSYKTKTSKNDHQALINKIKAPHRIKAALAVILEGVYVADDISEIDDLNDWVLKDGTIYRRGILHIPGEVNIENEYLSLLQILKDTNEERSLLESKLRILKSKSLHDDEIIKENEISLSRAKEALSTLSQKQKINENTTESLDVKKQELERSLAIEKLSHEKLNQQYQVVVKLINDKKEEIKKLEDNIIPVDKNIELDRQTSEQEVHDIKLNLASLNERLLFIKQQMTDNENEINSAGENLRSNEATIVNSSRIIEKLEVVKQCYEKFEMLVEIPYEHRVGDYNKEKQAINDLRQACREIGQKQGENNRKNEKLNIEEIEIKAKVDAITEKITEDFKVSLEKALELSDLEFESDEAARLEGQLKSMGPINFAAFEQFDQLKGREEFLEKQVEDLTTSKKSLRRIIRAIDDKIKEDMVDSFALVKFHFEKMFSILFPGGHSNLYLTDEEDVLNTGVELEVQPAGKKLSKLSLLSGGETALTALALLFAIYHAKPSPFYVLDEVEAALDDVNLQRFIRLVEDMKNQTQFLVITHQRRTMEIADCLYGVSMQADGISRVISQKLEKNIDVEEVEIA